MPGSVVLPKAEVETAAARAWRPMPTVLWPWACQLLVVDASTTAIDLVASAPRRIRGEIVEAGAPFSIHVTGPAVEAPVEQSGPVASDREPERVLTTQFCTRG